MKFSLKKIINSIFLLIENLFIYKLPKKNIKRFLHWADAQPIKALIFLFLFFTIIKIIITQIFIDPSNLVDGFVYTKMGYSLVEYKNFSIYGMPTSKYPPLYPISISPAFFFDSALTNIRIVKIFSAFFSSLIIFPVFFITKEFLNKKKSIVIACVISLMAGSIIWVFNVVSECLFYTLFLIAIFFIYKSSFEKGNKFKVLSGLIIGLCFLTRYTTIILFPTIIIYFIFIKLYEKNEKKINAFVYGLRDSIVVGCFTAIVILPWLIRNGNLFGYTIKGMLGYSELLSNTATKLSTIADEVGSIGKTQEINNVTNISETQIEGTTYIINFLTHFILTHGLLILACGIIFFILYIYLIFHIDKKKDKKLYFLLILTFIITELLICLSSIHNITLPWRLHGRYIEPVFPLIIILGFIAYFRIQNMNIDFIKKTLIIFLPIATVVSLGWGHMGGMISISYIGIIKDLPVYLNKFFGINFKSRIFLYPEILILILIFLMFFIFLYLINSNFSKKKIIALSLIIIFSSTALSTVGYMTREAYTSKSELYDLGIWLDENLSDKGYTIFLEEDLGYGINQISIWINGNLVVGKWNNNYTLNPDYLISKNKYNYSIEYSDTVSSNLQGIKGRDGWRYKIYVYNLNKKME